MTRLFLECAIRAALIVIGTAIVLYAMRVKVAAVKHRVWTGVLVLMLALPAWTAWGPKAELRLLPAAVQRFAGEPIAAPVAPATSATQSAAPTTPIAETRQRLFSTTEEILLGIYLLGALTLLARLMIGTMKASRLIREATLVDGIMTSGACVAPVTVGCLRPAVILPQHWREWTRKQLDVVLAHEGEHVRRRDPLVQWLALFNRAIFWFHPAAWWLERELSALAEEACDAAVIAQGHDPDAYAETLMKIARDVMDSGSRINSVAVAMPGPRLTRRIHKIIDSRLPSRLSGGRALLVIASCLATCGAFAAVRVTRAQSPSVQAALSAQAAAKMSFEVASVKPTKSGDERAPSLISPGGNFTATNNTLRALILNAYGIFATPYLLQGGPAWIDSARYDIDAKAAAGAIPAGTSNRVLWENTRLMLQSLLADRFKLSVHTETKEMASYELVVAKNGPKLKKSDVDCSASALACHGFSGNPTHYAGIGGVDMYDLAMLLSRYADHPVVDHTGVQGLFDITLQWNPFATGSQPAPDMLQSPVAGAKEGPRPDLASLPTMSEALEEQLGLKLQPIKGPVEIYVIDHVEEPTAN